MDFALSEEQVAFQDAARAFAQAEFAPHAAQWDAEKIFPVDALRLAARQGFAGIYCSEQHGGSWKATCSSDRAKSMVDSFGVGHS